MLVVLAHGEGPERLLAALAGTFGARPTVSVEPMPWGSLLLADAPHARSDRWLVAGRPQRDPWGLPLGDLPLDEAVAEFDRYGSHAANLGSGPFVVADLATGRLVRPPNGIVPAFHGIGECGPVRATSDLVLRLHTPDVKEIAPQHEQQAQHEQLRLRWDWLDQEITTRVARLGPMAPVTVPGTPDVCVDNWLARTTKGDVVFVPPLQRASDRATALSSTIAARLWSRARLGGRWLFAPTLERPVRDTVLLMAAGENKT
jgi:hypothetical protein